MAAAEHLWRGETKTVRERGRKGVRRTCNFNANLENKLTVTEGHPIGSVMSAPPNEIQAAALASSGQGRCGIGRGVDSTAWGSLFMALARLGAHGISGGRGQRGHDLHWQQRSPAS